MLKTIGQYFLFHKDVFSRPPRRKLFWRQVFSEIWRMGMDSLPIVVLLSVFMGAALTIQLNFNTDSPWLPLYTIGFIARQTIILEFSPTIISLILAGKVGSRISSEIGTMRVTEQIDALEVMGINPANYLVLPKVIACMFFHPILIMLSIGFAILGGYFAGVTLGMMSSYEFIYGLQFDFHTFDLFYALFKTVVFAYLITTISAFYGYFTQGGALEVGRASTKAVVQSSIMIIAFNLVVTQLMLS
ncbi:MAG: ABC transporter permease [Bacteroidales bacterium]|jgi:phospholipid/cholesterol/gamma-HCH transport system permease protein|nr:ABC transporter permease [Bacteroidales bacterium]